MDYKSFEKIYEEKIKNKKVDVDAIIKELIETSWAGSNEEQGKAVQLLRGLAFSDDPKSNAFMKALDKATSNMKAPGPVKEENIEEVNVIDMIAQPAFLRSLMKAIKDDKQSIGILKNIYEFFNKKFTMSKREEAAFNRFRNLLGSHGTSPEMIRNQIFKIADDLGMKLPTAMF